MKIPLRIPVVICRDGKWSAGGYCVAGGGKTSNDDLALLYEGFPDEPEDTMRKIYVTAEVDIGALFEDVEVAGQVT